MNGRRDPWADNESSQDGFNIFGDLHNATGMTENLLTNFEDDDADFMDTNPTSSLMSDQPQQDLDLMDDSPVNQANPVFGLPLDFKLSSLDGHILLKFAKGQSSKRRSGRSPSTVDYSQQFLYGIYIPSESLKMPSEYEDELRLLRAREPEVELAYKMVHTTLLEFFPTHDNELIIRIEPLLAQAKWLTIFIKRNPVILFFLSFDYKAYSAFESAANEEEKAWPLTFSREVIGSTLTKIPSTSAAMNPEESLAMSWLNTTTVTPPDFSSRIYFMAKLYLITSRNTNAPDTSFVQNETSTLAQEIKDNPSLISTSRTSETTYDDLDDTLTRTIATYPEPGTSSKKIPVKTKATSQNKTNSRRKRERPMDIVTADDKEQEANSTPKQDGVPFDPEASVIARIFGEIYVDSVSSTLASFNSARSTNKQQNGHNGDPNEKLKSNRKVKLSEEIEPYVLTATQDSIIHNGSNCIAFPTSVTLVNLKSAFLTALSIQPKLTKKRSRLKTAYPASWTIFITDYILKSSLTSSLLFVTTSESFKAGNQMYMRFICLINELVIKPYHTVLAGKNDLLSIALEGIRITSSGGTLASTEQSSLASAFVNELLTKCGIIIDLKKKDVVKLNWRLVKAQSSNGDQSSNDTQLSSSSSSLVAKRCILSKIPLDNVDHFVLECAQTPVGGEFIWVHTESHTNVVEAVVSAFLLFDILLPRLTETTISASINHHLATEGLLKVEDRAQEINACLNKPDASIYKGSVTSVPINSVDLLPSNRKYEIALASFFQKYIASYPRCIQEEEDHLITQQNPSMQVDIRSNNNNNHSGTLATSVSSSSTKKVRLPVHNMDYLKSVLLEKILVAINMLAAIRARFIHKAREYANNDNEHSNKS